MAEIINLNQARKARTKARAETAAAANRVKFGRDKARKQAEKIETDRASRSLDDTKREP